MMKATLGWCAAALTLLGSFALAQDSRYVNKLCPVDDRPVLSGMTVRYENWVLGFCSGPCRLKFIKSPKPYIGRIPELSAGGQKEAPKAEEAPVPAGKCDMKKVAKAPFCATCSRELGADDVRNNLCKKCQTKPVQAEFCVKRLNSVYKAECHPEKTSDKPFIC